MATNTRAPSALAGSLAVRTALVAALLAADRAGCTAARKAAPAPPVDIEIVAAPALRPPEPTPGTEGRMAGPPRPDVPLARLATPTPPAPDRARNPGVAPRPAQAPEIAIEDPALVSPDGSAPVTAPDGVSAVAQIGDIASGLGGLGTGLRGDGTGGGARKSDGGIGRMPVPISGHRLHALPYTEDAVRQRTHGDIIVRILVDARGRVADARILRGLGHGLDEIALDLARNIRFQPAVDGRGRPIAIHINWRFEFSPP